MIGKPFIILPSVDSTNNYAMGLIHAGMAKHGTAVFALEQTQGKGQRGKVWNSIPGLNIVLSVVIRPATVLGKPFVLSAAVALACYDLFSKYAGAEVSLKWPNDLYWRDRKAGGILIESSGMKGRANRYVAGIGININQTEFPESVQNAVSLKQITGKEFDVQQLAKELCEHLELRWQQVLSLDSTVLPDYNQVLYRLNESVRLKKENAVFETTIKGVNYAGELITEDTIERSFRVGEVVWA
jgi:BirA family transcriptional regulator, biotin operon repressor / biotin---[acetyl-CoA-carboxylase] ligase